MGQILFVTKPDWRERNQRYLIFFEKLSFQRAETVPTISELLNETEPSTVSIIFFILVAFIYRVLAEM